MKKLLLVVMVLCGFGDKVYSQTGPTWAENVACILYSRCTSCHNPAGIAPFSLMNFADASGAAMGILDAVQNKRMPPWPPDADYRSFAHERVLTDTEKQILIDWVNNGSPQGDPANAPVPPVYTNQEMIQNPDLVSAMTQYTIPPMTQDLYRCFVIPSGTTIDQFITALEVVPGNRQVVHHVLVYQDTANTTVVLDSLDPFPGYTSFGGVGSSTAKLLGAWVPGAEANFLPAGMGIPLPAGAKIILQMHYPMGSSLQMDSTKVNFTLTANPATREVTVAPVLNHGFTLSNGPLFIPADSVRTFNAQLVNPINVTLLAVAPHMHLIGRSIVAYAVSFPQDTIPLIRIPNWDFHWQGAYHFRQPVRVPAWAQFKSEAIYDNTVNNPFNPSIPPQDVSLGEATTDEMMLIYFYFTPYQPGDENIIVDTSTAVPVYNGCNFVTSITANAGVLKGVYCYPVPATESIIIDLPGQNIYTIEVYDALGRCVRMEKQVLNDKQWDVSELEPGVYQLLVSTESTRTSRSFVVQR